MSTDLLNPIPGPAPANAEQPDLSPTPPTGRPPFVPVKFWDPASGQVRLEALCLSYRELERRFGAETRPEDETDDMGAASAAPCCPPSPQDYAISIQDDLLDVDDEVNARLHACGFNNDQAQLVYDLATERALPLIMRLAEDYHNGREQDKLERHFGGEERWAELAHQIQAWAAKNLPEDVRVSLSSSADGVIAMHRMMTSNEPSLFGGGGGQAEAVTEEKLRSMMQDPKYWREKDPALVRRVSEGFRTLYPG